MNDNNELIRRMEAEAVKRMNMLGMFEPAVFDFKECSRIYASEEPGFIYSLTDEEEQRIRDWEEKTGNMVYHAIRCRIGFNMLALLIVSKYEEDWRMDREELEAGRTMAYVFNLDVPEYSEYGTIGVENQFGGLVRTF